MDHVAELVRNIHDLVARHVEGLQGGEAAHHLAGEGGEQVGLRRELAQVEAVPELLGQQLEPIVPQAELHQRDETPDLGGQVQEAVAVEVQLLDAVHLVQRPADVHDEVVARLQVAEVAQRQHLVRQRLEPHAGDVHVPGRAHAHVALAHVGEEHRGALRDDLKGRVLHVPRHGQAQLAEVGHGAHHKGQAVQLEVGQRQLGEVRQPLDAGGERGEVVVVEV